MFGHFYVILDFEHLIIIVKIALNFYLFVNLYQIITLFHYVDSYQKEILNFEFGQKG
jgi:hypothetical protein